jgi:hypothetical protein
MMSEVQVEPKFPSEPSFQPASEAQWQWLNSRAELLLGGGSVGSLKTSTALIDGSVEYDNSNMHTIMFRKTLAEHFEAIRISREWFANTGAVFEENSVINNGTGVPNFNGNSHIWRWPWGSTFQFAYCATDNDVYAHQTQSYTCILWDESTRTASEFMVRYLLTRLRSTDPTLFLRCRLGTNPGGPFADWHMKMFLGGVCPHCEPAVREPGRIYRDATWPSDGRALEGMSTQFIFSKVTDHGLLGEKYIRNIRMQHAATAEALLAGCWRAFEGQYYDIWDRNTMVVKRQTVGDKWYWEHWVGADYGFSGSKAAAYLFTRSPDTGTIYCIDEYVSSHEPVRDFARSVYEKFAKKRDGEEQPRKLHMMYLSPDAWNDRGDQHTLAGQMNDVLMPNGLVFVQAKNDRAGGAMLIYEMLRDGKLRVADNCTLIQTALEAAEHDPKQPEAVLSRPSDPKSDANDGFRYGVYSHHMIARKPLEVRIQERVGKEFQSDPTSAMFHAAKIREEEKAKDAPQIYGGLATRRRIAAWEKNRRG